MFPVTNPLGQSTIVNKLIRNYLLTVGEHVFLAYLLLLSFHEFDIILGQDCLTRRNVMVNCRSKSVLLVSAEDKELLLFGKQSELATIIISAVSSKKLIVQGIYAYLAYILDTLESRSGISQVLVVREIFGCIS